jgi:hypothetical protein
MVRVEGIPRVLISASCALARIVELKDICGFSGKKYALKLKCYCQICQF